MIQFDMKMSIPCKIFCITVQIYLCLSDIKPEFIPINMAKKEQFILSYRDFFFWTAPDETESSLTWFRRFSIWIESLPGLDNLTGESLAFKQWARLHVILLSHQAQEMQHRKAVKQICIESHRDYTGLFSKCAVAYSPPLKGSDDCVSELAYL